jgi:hypothetical protein
VTVSRDLAGVVLLVHAAATVFLTGLSWTVQAVHYPLFAAVGGDFARYEAEHARRISRLLALPWTVELLTALALPVLLSQVPGRPVPLWMPVAGLALLAVVVAVTMLGAVPAHGRLGHGFDPDALRALLRADRVRVAGWTARSVLALAMLALA